MTGSTRSSEGLDPRRRRVLFRSWHRGIREMDLIMGRFSDAHIAELTDAELDEYERLMELRDQEVLSWIDGTGVVPPDYDTALFRRLRDFNRANGR
jgi:antitoxin CptB